MSENPRMEGESREQLVEEIGRLRSELEALGQVEAEHKRAEEALRESEEFSSSLMSNSPNAILVINPDTSVRYANRAFEELTGFSAAEVTGARAPYPWWTEETLHKTAEDLREAMRQGARRVEELFQKKNGERFWAEISSAPVIRDGKFLYYLANWVDVTERKRADEALRESEEKYHNLISNLSGVVVMEIDSRGKFTYVSPQILDVFGHTPEESIGLAAFDFVHPDDIGKCLEAMATKEEVVDLEYRSRHKDGHYVYISTTGKRVPDGRGGTKIVSIVRDITERKKAEEALRESEARIRALLNAPSDAMILIDSEGIVLSINKTHAEKLGKDVDDIPGKCIYDFFPSDIAQCRKAQADKTFSTGKPVLFEEKGREGRTYDTCAYPVFDAGGKVTAVAVYARDITERKRMEEALRENEERYRAVFESTGTSTIIVEEDTTISLVNREFENLSGYSKEEVEGKKSWTEFVAKEDLKRMKEYHKSRRMDPASAPRNYELRFVDRQGNVKNGFLTVAMIPGTRKSVSSLSDITERKRAEEELEASRQELRELAEHIQSAREEERTGIARELHDDIGQALTAIKIDLSWLRKELPKDEAMLLERTRAVLRVADSAIQTVRRISSELRPGILDDLGLTAAIQWQAGEFEERTGVKCEVSVEREVIILEQDRSTAVFRIFQEALTNVARHAAATRVRVNLGEADGRLVLEIADDGKGITARQLSSRKAFGLMGMKERAAFLGGELQISGGPGKGTRVVVSIPLRREGDTGPAAGKY